MSLGCPGTVPPADSGVLAMGCVEGMVNLLSGRLSCGMTNQPAQTHRARGSRDDRKEEQMTEPRPKRATFETTVAASGNNTGMVVPDEVIEQLAAGKRPSVLVDVNGYEYRNTVAVMGGQYMIGISAAIRKATGLKGGDPIRVTLTVADTPRDVNVPADFAAALAADEAVEAFFGKLSNSLQRYHVDNVNAAKTAETRQRRIEKAVALFRNGQKR